MCTVDARFSKFSKIPPPTELPILGGLNPFMSTLICTRTRALTIDSLKNLLAHSLMHLLLHTHYTNFTLNSVRWHWLWLCIDYIVYIVQCILTVHLLYSMQCTVNIDSTLTVQYTVYSEHWQYIDCTVYSVHNTLTVLWLYSDCIVTMWHLISNTQQ